MEKYFLKNISTMNATPDEKMKLIKFQLSQAVSRHYTVFMQVNGFTNTFKKLIANVGKITKGIITVKELILIVAWAIYDLVVRGGMLSLILEGYLTPKDLESFFPFMSRIDIFNFLAQFNPSYITSLVSKIFIEDPLFIRKFTYKSLGEKLGVSKSTISNWVRRNIFLTLDPNRHGFKWGGREKILFECYWRPVARLYVGSSSSKTSLLSTIRWEGGDVDDKMRCLFYETGVGAPNENYYLSAKYLYSDYTLQDLDVWFINKCSYFTHLNIGISDLIDLLSSHFQSLFFP